MIICKCAKWTEEGYVCSITGDCCMFCIPDGKLCYEKYGEENGYDPNKNTNDDSIVISTIYDVDDDEDYDYGYEDYDDEDYDY